MNLVDRLGWLSIIITLIMALVILTAPVGTVVSSQPGCDFKAKNYDCPKAKKDCHKMKSDCPKSKKECHKMSSTKTGHQNCDKKGCQKMHDKPCARAHH